jgi:[ribulose-bisphosphate carboxylase]-lysine N-methyltransferase
MIALVSPVHAPTGTQVLESTLGYMEYAESEFEGVQEYVFGPNPSVFPPEVYNAESFLWAFGILRSRTFAPFVGENIALVPGLDLMNHNAYGVVKLERRKTGLFSGESAAALVSVAASVEGEQVGCGR